MLTRITLNKNKKKSDLQAWVIFIKAIYRTLKCDFYIFFKSYS